MIDTGGKEVDEWKEEKDMVKRKKDWYLLDHHIPIHSPEGPVIAPAPLAVLVGLQGKQHIHRIRVPQEQWGPL
jgi:hypothetical protein